MSLLSTPLPNGRSIPLKSLHIEIRRERKRKGERKRDKKKVREREKWETDNWTEEEKEERR
jgi:hypothetical protein